MISCIERALTGVSRCGSRPLMCYCFCRSLVSCPSPFLQNYNKGKGYLSNILANAGITSLSSIPGRGQSPSLAGTFPSSILPHMAFHSARKLCVNEM